VHTSAGVLGCVFGLIALSRHRFLPTISIDRFPLILHLQFWGKFLPRAKSIFSRNFEPIFPRRLLSATGA
jgi:hypothetical protein